MQKAVFETRLRTAAGRAVAFAREFVVQSLPDELALRVYPNQSCDENPRVGDETTFPTESLPFGRFHGPWTNERAVKYLWRGGKVPEWIDVSVEAEDGARSLVGLRCCGRFTATEELLYHRHGGLPPFSVKSPVLPPGWEGIEASGRFDLYRRRPARRPWWKLW